MHGSTIIRLTECVDSAIVQLWAGVHRIFSGIVRFHQRACSTRIPSEWRILFSIDIARFSTLTTWSRSSTRCCGPITSTEPVRARWRGDSDSAGKPSISPTPPFAPHACVGCSPSDLARKARTRSRPSWLGISAPNTRPIRRWAIKPWQRPQPRSLASGCTHEPSGGCWQQAFFPLRAFSDGAGDGEDFLCATDPLQVAYERERARVLADEACAPFSLGRQLAQRTSLGRWQVRSVEVAPRPWTGGSETNHKRLVRVISTMLWDADTMASPVHEEQPRCE
jgi:hypothetical protein